MSGSEVPEQIAYVNGDYVALDQARVSVLDRGFLFADSVYEVIPVYDGRCYRLADHIARLQRSLAGIRLAHAHTPGHWTTLIETLVSRNGGGELSVYLQVTRGVAPWRDHRLPDHPEPTVVGFCQPRAAVSDGVLRRGIKAVTLADTRWQYCTIKSTALLANVLAADDARAAGATEALLTREGCVQEGTSSNVFGVINGELVTPALRDSILPGITRAARLELARPHDVPHAEVDDLTVAQIGAASEIWISSSTREIYPVTQLDDAPVGDGRPGPLWTQMRAWLQADSHA